MVLRSSVSIDLEIVKMRKRNCGIYTIHKWLIKWGDFQNLDEQIVLAYILNILDENEMAVSRNEVLYCFNKHYNQEYHIDKKGYLGWLYKTFHVKVGTRVRTSQNRKVQGNKKHSSSWISDTKTPFKIEENQRKPITPSIIPKRAVRRLLNE